MYIQKKVKSALHKTVSQTAINLPFISKFSKHMPSYICFYLQNPVCFTQKLLLSVLHLNHSSLFSSSFLIVIFRIVLVIRRTVKNLNAFIISLSYVIHRQKLEINTASTTKLSSTLCKFTQKDPEIQKNKLNKSQWDGIYFLFLQRKETRHHSFFLSPVTIHNILYKNTI